ncbi:unnamed protein product [Dibothriocephalus latus]|uniref:Uncharacterized protein n=1 Tax=Dibothriocephalus latus TaxID=60516 RepID=A0A3P7NK31_DIBLA|nr:unnamed protein product [Dibothriocephalus latus]
MTLSLKHYDVFLVFRPEDIFWDRNAAQLNSSDANLHILNLDRFGNCGVLLFHIWAGSPHVTRWSEDPFSLGAYTAGEPDSGDQDRRAYAESLPLDVSHT